MFLLFFGLLASMALFVISIARFSILVVIRTIQFILSFIFDLRH